MFNKNNNQTDNPESGAAKKSGSTVKAGISTRLAGEAKDFKTDLKPYLPQEIIGGSVPYIAGSEEEAVWNAASQATGTERVHYVYTVEDNRCWYIATPSSSLSSNPDSWCPLAAALPGNSEFWDKDTVYIYERDGMASALRWEDETNRMQVFIGASRTLLPKMQSMDANFVTLDAENAQVVPWRNRQLHTERLSRATARILLLSGLFLILILFCILAYQYVSINVIQRDLDKVRLDTKTVSTDLMLQAYNALQSDTIKHMVRIQELLDHLTKVDGTLVRYQINGNRTEWEALVPQSFSGCDAGPLRGCKVQPGLEKDGRVRIKGLR